MLGREFPRSKTDKREVAKTLPGSYGRKNAGKAIKTK